MDFQHEKNKTADEMAEELEKASKHLSHQNNPHNIGIDTTVYAIAKLIRSLAHFDKSNKKINRTLVWLTTGLFIFTIVIAWLTYEISQK